MSHRAALEHLVRIRERDAKGGSDRKVDSELQLLGDQRKIMKKHFYLILGSSPMWKSAGF